MYLITEAGSRSAGASLGDPAMANMIPPEQYLEDYTFSTVGDATKPINREKLISIVAKYTSPQISKELVDV